MFQFLWNRKQCKWSQTRSHQLQQVVCTTGSTGQPEPCYKQPVLKIICLDKLLILFKVGFFFLTDWSLSPRQHGIGYMKCLCYGHRINGLWLLLLKPKRGRDQLYEIQTFFVSYGFFVVYIFCTGNNEHHATMVQPNRTVICMLANDK